MTLSLYNGCKTAVGWLRSLNHRDADTGELKPRMHQVAFTSKPTIEDDCPYRCADSGRFPGLG